MFANVKFGQEINYLINQRIELGVCSIKKIDYEEVYKYLKEKISIDQLYRLNEIHLDVFHNKQMKQLYEYIRSQYF